jgi:hypothetical protein
MPCSLTRRLFFAAGLAATLATTLRVSAQPASKSLSGKARQTEAALDQLLTTLEANVDDYTHSVPSFLCDEHTISEMEPTPNPGGTLRTVTDAVFRVRRYSDPDFPAAPSQLNESRILKAVNGKPPSPNAEDDPARAGAPMSVVGIFSNGLNLVALSGKACFRYKLHPARKNHPYDKIVIEFEDLPLKDRAEDCPSNGSISGRATISQSSLRVVRLETTTRNHQSQLGFMETWDWAIDYAPVTLSGKTFWMPAAIRSKAVPDTGSTSATFTSGRRGGGSTNTIQNHPLTYTLDARYSDYHLLNVTSRIVPTAEANSPTPPAPAPTVPAAPEAAPSASSVPPPNR